MWSLTSLPPNAVLWVVSGSLKVKGNPDGSVSKYKAPLIAKGFHQQADLNFSKAFYPGCQTNNYSNCSHYITSRRMVSYISTMHSLIELLTKTSIWNNHLDSNSPIAPPHWFLSYTRLYMG